MFRAYEPERDRLVAVKVFRLDLPPEKVHQFVAELDALIGADLTHPGIAAPLRAGIADTSAYLVQDFVAADSLDIVIRDFGPAPAADALRVATQLAGALDFAAVVNVTHGGLHPRDLLVSPDDARLTGMGITSALEKVGITTPVRRPYTAPERAAGEPWDRRADVFSLAALVFELLWGRRIAGSGGQAVASMSDLAVGDPVAMRQVFARALADDPRDRFATALAFAEALTGACGLLPSTGSRMDARRGTPSSAETRVEEPPESVAPALPAVALAQEPAPEFVSAPRLPLDEPGIDAAPVAPVSLDDLELRTAEPSRYEEAESAPTFAVSDAEEDTPPPLVVGLGLSPAVRPPSEPAPIRMPMRAAEPASLTESALERSRSAVWPLLLALVIGVVIGFALAVSMLERSRPSVQTADVEPAPPRPAATTGARARDFTEDAVAKSAAPEPLPSAGSAPAAQIPEPPPPPAARASAPAPTQPQPQVAARSQREPARGAGRAATAVPAANSGRILVRSTPAGARVVVDGRDVGESPVTLYELAQGSHTVRVMREGYFTAERRVSISAAQPAQSLTIELRRAGAETPEPATPGTIGRFAGALAVDSRPPGANVYLDGKQVGVTPLLLDSLEAGEHAVRLELDGYRRWTSSVRVVAGDRNRVTASLEK